jgi:beta-lactamase superfamily II metal-dependent hydrolase
MEGLVRSVCAVLFAITLAAPSGRAQAPQPKGLDIYFIDVEGGQATLFVSPSGETMLVDAGYPEFDGRDAGRIAAAAKQAGVSRLDYVVVTHYHTDHVGGVPAIAAKLPIGAFVDHGPTTEKGAAAEALYAAYVEARKAGRHIQVKPGDKIPVRGMDVTVVSADGNVLDRPLPGAGAPNPLCRDFTPHEVDASENAHSVGMAIGYGRFRIIDLGDLTWNKEQALVCPNNLLGTTTAYLTTHHGLAASGPPVIVHALRPRVAVMNNGAKKGGAPSAWQIVRESPGLEDLWQLHYAVDAGADHNTAEPLIANLDETTSYGIKISARQDGSFTVTNARNGRTKTYVVK